jgi:hypothetical protein
MQYVRTIPNKDASDCIVRESRKATEAKQKLGSIDRSNNQCSNKDENAINGYTTATIARATMVLDPPCVYFVFLNPTSSLPKSLQRLLPVGSYTPNAKSLSLPTSLPVQ